MSLEAALKKWANSKEGKAQLKQSQINAIKKGDFRGAFGGPGGLDYSPEFYAEEFIEILRNEIRASSRMDGTPFEYGDYLYWVDIGYDETREKYVLHINFDETNLHRESWYAEKYRDGVSNIAALINTGYRARDYVYNKETGQRSLKIREGEFYVQSAVSKFLSMYGDHISIEIGDEFISGVRGI